MLALAGLLVAGQIDLTAGELVVGGSTYNQSIELSSAVGLGGAVGYYGRILSIAFAPHYVPEHTLAGEYGATFAQFDAGVQLGIHNAITPRVELLAQLTPAYSMLYDDVIDDASGLALTVGGGAVYRLSQRFQIGATASYQYGTQHTSEGDLAATRLLSLGVFVMAR